MDETAVSSSVAPPGTSVSPEPSPKKLPVILLDVIPPLALIVPEADTSPVAIPFALNTCTLSVAAILKCIWLSSPNFIELSLSLPTSKEVFLIEVKKIY